MKRNLLFISRYPEIIDEFQGILEEKQIETEIAQNGTDAMELLKQKEYQKAYEQFDHAAGRNSCPDGTQRNRKNNTYSFSNTIF